MNVSAYLTVTPSWLTYPILGVFAIGVLVVALATVGLVIMAVLTWWWHAGGNK